MSENAILDIIKTILPALTSMLGIWVGSTLSQKSAKATAIGLIGTESFKFAQQRLWEARREAYGSILGLLAKTARQAIYAASGFRSQVQDPDAFVASEEYVAILGSIGELWNSVIEKYDETVAILSDDFEKCFQEIAEGIGSGTGERMELAELWSEVFRRGHGELRSVAKSDLQPGIITSVGKMMTAKEMADANDGSIPIIEIETGFTRP